MLRPVVEVLIGGVIACGLLIIGKIAPHIVLDGMTAYGAFLVLAFIAILYTLFGDRK